MAKNEASEGKAPDSIRKRFSRAMNGQDPLPEPTSSESGIKAIDNYLEGLSETIPNHILQLRIRAMKSWAISTQVDGTTVEETNAGRAVYEDMSRYVMRDIFGEDVSSLKTEGQEELEHRVEEIFRVTEQSFIDEFKEGDQVDPLEFGEKYIAPTINNLRDRLIANKVRKLNDDVLEHDEVRNHLTQKARSDGIEWYKPENMATGADIRSHLQTYLKLKAGKQAEKEAKKVLGYTK